MSTLDLDAIRARQAEADARDLLDEVERLAAELDVMYRVRDELVAERDEARAEVERLRAGSDVVAAAVAYVNVPALLAEVEQWRATFGESALRQAQEILAERAALLAEVAELRDLREASTNLHANAESELAEARAEVERLRATVAAYLETDERGIHHAANTAHARAQRDEAIAETQEIAAELAQERTEHQRTLDEVDRLRADLAVMYRVRDDLAATVERVRAVHRAVDEDAHGVYGCSGCDIGESWPCPTIRALDAAVSTGDGTNSDG